MTPIDKLPHKVGNPHSFTQINKILKKISKTILLRTHGESIAKKIFNRQVCHDLGIVCETDYFGLLYATSSHMPRTVPPNMKQWINLRNPLDKRHHRGEGPILLELRVKFWVPGHLILQENVRLVENFIL
jgi:hypothetical protein